MDSRIGKLGNGNYYAYVNGYNADPIIGTLEEVSVALGLNSKKSAKPAVKPSEYKTYTVKIRTSELVDVVEIEALNRNKAISKARDWYRDEYARPRLPAKYSARMTGE